MVIKSKHEMLAKISRKNLILVVGTTVALCAIFILIIQSTQARTERGADKTAISNQSKAQPMQATDKAEIPTEIEVSPPVISPAVTSAEQQMPPTSAPAYENACERLKQMYGNERDRNINSENNTHAANQQAIINRYSNEGMSFSKAEKTEQSKELRRHNAMLDQIQKQYGKQLSSISC